jgi:hypothetical protein
MDKQVILAAIRRGLEHLAREQRSDGSFASLSSLRQDDFSDAITYSTTFFTSNILICLGSLTGVAENQASAKDVRRRAARFLQQEKSDRWSWNYWARGAKERKTMPYPDDLDDTFAALAALARHDPGLIDGKALASIVKMLTGLETKEGGPYRTWLVPESAPLVWQDVDLAVNSTVGYFLSLVNVRVPNLERLVEDAIAKDLIKSPYYPGPCQVFYFISRFYKGVEKEKVATLITDYQKRHRAQMNPLERAMLISALADLGFKKKIPPEEIASLIKTIKKEGWRPYAFCIDPTRDHKTSYAGSSALTAAFCIEALAKYVTAFAKQATTGNAKKGRHHRGGATAVDRIAIHRRTQALAKQACRDIATDLQNVAIREIEKTNDPKITALAYEFRTVLGARGRAVSPKTVERLSLANLYGWMAYTIYDDFLDEEGDPLLLSCANLFLRKLARIYDGLGEKAPGIKNLFDHTMDTIDAANTWEQIHCRVPKEKRTTWPERLPQLGNYENLADRSIGHAMGPLAEVLLAGSTANSKQYRAVASFFRHYLIARQLHDDAHDWADDLSRGQINSVGALVLGGFQKKFRRKNDQVATLLPRLRYFFWNEVVDEVVRLVCAETAAARSALEQSGLVQNDILMETMLSSLEQAARRTLEERNETLKFLKNYKA